MTETAKPLRVDAERNRQAIICAAGSIFADEGTAVTLEHIAEIAGVGVGTIYRRFSSVDELVAVVLEEKMRHYADRIELEAERARAEPWEAFRDFVLYALEQQAADLAFSDVLLSPRTSDVLFHQENKRALRASVKLVDRVKKAGAIRADFDSSDLYMLFNANAGLVRATHASAPQAWLRFGQYMLQSFRHSGDEAFAPPSQVWLRAQSTAD